MFSISASAISELTNSLIKSCGGLLSIAVILRSDIPDLLYVTLNEQNIQFGICCDHETEERRHFFFERLRATMRLFVGIKNRRPNIVGAYNVWLDDISVHPGLVFSVSRPGQIAIPDPLFIESNAYSIFRSEVEKIAPPWGDRLTRIYWRGSSTGYRSAERPRWDQLQRFALCKLVTMLPESQNFDCKVTNIVQISDPTEVEEIKNSELTSNEVSQTEFLKYRHTIDLCGNTTSWPGLFCKLLGGNTILKIDGYENHSQWYYKEVLPWKHYVPVYADFSDLQEASDWLLNNPNSAREIASSGQLFAMSKTFEQVLADTIKILDSTKST